MKIIPHNLFKGENEVAIYESGEMYLETILVLKERTPFVRAVDVADKLSVAKSSVSEALRNLKKGGYIEIEATGNIVLTDEGSRVAVRIFERHKVLKRFFISIGVDEKHADEDACRIEHFISDETFSCIGKHLEEMENK